jgi:acetyltransferase-like isoleucine patch superfamily enzyme
MRIAGRSARLPKVRDLTRLGTSFERRYRALRLWHDYHRGLTPPPPRAFARFGPGTFLLPPARVEMPECIELGRNVRIHENGWLCLKALPGSPPPRLVIGNNVTIGRFAKIVCAGHVVIEDDALIGDQVYIADTHYTHDDHARPIGQQPLAPPRAVHIGPGSFVGVRAMIQPGVTLGANAYVGAAAIVGCDVPAHTVAVGDPARIVRRYDPTRGDWARADDEPRS